MRAGTNDRSRIATEKQNGCGGTREIIAAYATRGITSIVLTGLLASAVAAQAQAADVGKGAQIYAKHCAACHGPNGVSVMPGAPHLARGEGLMQADLALLAVFKAGKNVMPAYLGILSDRDILDVIAYSRTLRR